MARNSLEINQLCRLCLCQDEDILFPASKLIDSTLTLDDIERFTGVWLMEKESVPYVMCLDCNNKLKNSVTFRSNCLKIDAQFRKLFGVIVEDGSNDRPDSTSSMLLMEVLSDDNYEVKQQDVSTEEYIVETLVDAVEETDQLGDELIVEELHEKFKDINDDGVDDDGDRFTEELEAEEFHISCLDNLENDSDALEEPRHPETEPNSNDSDTTAGHLPQECDQTLSSAFEGQPKRARCSEERLRKRDPPAKQLCPLCGKLIQSLADHMLSHTKEPKFSCKYCPMTCSRKGYLKLHVAAVHMKRVVKTCEMCDKGFSYIESYDAHMRSKHNVGEPFECKICGIKFRHKGGLRSHNNRKHNDDSNCTCSICGMKFQDKKGLREHGRVHSNDKPYGCKHCPKWFKSSKSLKTHELTHEGVKFPCKMCDKIYTYKSLLNMHIKKCHPEIINKTTSE